MPPWRPLTWPKGIFKELRKKLLDEERERKNVAALLDSAEKQAEGQRILLRNTED